jgi:two-component system cell cycle sensor histidine kinase PleC
MEDVKPPFEIPNGTSSVLRDGTPAFASIRALRSPYGHVVTIQSQAAALSQWWNNSTLTTVLSLTTGFVVLILGFAFHWQATRAREADQIYETVQSRIDAALNSGLCGLWDWDVTKSKVFWSRSMFELLGLDRRDPWLAVDEISTFVHPSDIELQRFAAQLTGTERSAIEASFRMRHVRRGWIWIRARYQLVVEPKDSSYHLLGIAVELRCEQRPGIERNGELAPIEMLESMGAPLAIWDTHRRLLFCNPAFQKFHGLTDEAMLIGVHYQDVFKETVRYSSQNDLSRQSLVRDFEAQLDDGRWIVVNETQTSIGLISVESDITWVTARKEEPAVSSERAPLQDIQGTAVYPQTLVRWFGVGVVTAALGAALCVGGLMLSEVILQLCGAGFLALGTTTASLIVLSGQEFNEPPVDARPR